MYACCVTSGFVCLNMNFNQTDCCNQVNPSVLVTNLANYNAYIAPPKKGKENLGVNKQEYSNLKSDFYLNIHMNYHPRALLYLSISVHTFYTFLFAEVISSNWIVLDFRNTNPMTLHFRVILVSLCVSVWWVSQDDCLCESLKRHSKDFKFFFTLLSVYGNQMVFPRLPFRRIEWEIL